MPSPTPTATPIVGPCGDNSAGTGSTADSFIPGNSEPAGVTPGRFLLSVVAIQGTGASSAFLCLPTDPGPWTLIGDWPCDGGSGNEIHVAAAYRITNASDSPGTGFSWTFSSTPCGSQIAADFIGSVINFGICGGVNTTTPIDVVGSPTCNLGAAGGTVVASAITTTNNNDAILGIFDAANIDQSLSLSISGSDLGPVVNESNTGFGPANFTAYRNADAIGISCQSPPGFNNGECGPAGVYGPFSATQAVAGESVGVTLSLVPGS